MSDTQKGFSIKDNWILLLLWLAVSIININKAFHIDDSFHLESAQWIEKHPLMPMSGYINWYNNPEPMSHFNQPPLLFYLIALVGMITGYNEPGLHLIIAFFSFLALYFFQKLSLLFESQRPKLLLGIFALCPAFIVNQNLMTDIPILALELGFIYHLLKIDHGQKHLLYSMLLLSASVLIKYSMLPLLVAALIAVLIKRRYKALPYLLIPVLALLLWSVWNKIEYGGIHIKDRPKNELSFKIIFDQFRAMIECLGSMLPVALLLWSGIIQKKVLPFISVLAISGFFFFAYQVYFDKIDEGKASEILTLLFLVIGSLIIISALYQSFVRLIPAIRQKEIQKEFRLITALLCLGGLAGFLIIYAPFTATRHVLLLIPIILLITAPLIDRAFKSSAAIALGSTAGLGLLLAISDWTYADFYRTMPARVKSELEGRVWSAGHWGWQWYSAKEGMLIYAEDSVKVNEGDYLVYPSNISKQDINSNLELREVTRLWNEADLRTFFSVHRFASLYNSYVYKPSWQFSKSPVDFINVYEIRFKKDSTTVYNRIPEGNKP